MSLTIFEYGWELLWVQSVCCIILFQHSRVLSDIHWVRTLLWAVRWITSTALLPPRAQRLHRLALSTKLLATTWLRGSGLLWVPRSSPRQFWIRIPRFLRGLCDDWRESYSFGRRYASKWFFHASLWTWQWVLPWMQIPECWWSPLRS